jgi:hypothetical protein
MTNHEEQSGRAEVLPLAIMWRNPQGFVQAQLRLREASHPYYGWAEQSRSKSPDFFDVEKFPSLHFNSSDIRTVRDGELSVEGDLTVHGITRKVRFMVEGPTPPTKDPWQYPNCNLGNNEDQPRRLRLDLERGTRDRRHPCRRRGDYHA